MDKRLNKLKIIFPEGWIDISRENPNGPPTFIDGKIEESGVLQISTADYISGDIPNPDFYNLVNLSKNIGLKNRFGIVQNEESGICPYGKYGFVEFSGPEFPYISVWHLSDEKNFVFATYICVIQPDTNQISDVIAILKSIRKSSFLGKIFK